MKICYILEAYILYRAVEGFGAKQNKKHKYYTIILLKVNVFKKCTHRTKYGKAFKKKHDFLNKRKQ